MCVCAYTHVFTKSPSSNMVSRSGSNQPGQTTCSELTMYSVGRACGTHEALASAQNWGGACVIFLLSNMYKFSEGLSVQVLYPVLRTMMVGIHVCWAETSVLLGG